MRSSAAPESGLRSKATRQVARFRASLNCSLLCLLAGLAVAASAAPTLETAGRAAVAKAGTASILSLSEYQKQEWQVEDGLPQSDVRMIAQRPDGLLLIASASGLSTFDGLHFQPMPIDVHQPLANDAVNAILYTRDGDLWIGTDGRGVIRRTPSGISYVSEQAGLFGERIRALHQSADGALWIATQNGIERRAGDQLELLHAGMVSGDITETFAEDGSGGMYLVTSQGLYHWSGGALTLCRLGHPELGAPTAVHRDARQRIWLGRMNGAELLIPTAGAQFVEQVEPGVLGPVTAVIGDENGSLWMGSRRKGLSRISPQGVTHWTSADGLPSGGVESLFEDDEHNIWIGMLTGGLGRWRRAPLIPFGAPEGMPDAFSANVLSDHRGDLWLGTWGAGLFRLHDGVLQHLDVPELPASGPIRALAEDKAGHLWIGTWQHGLFEYDGSEFHHYLLGSESPGNAVSAIASGPSGTLWVGTYLGVLAYPRGYPDGPAPTPLLPGHRVTCLLVAPDGSLLIGTARGLFRERGGRISAISDLPDPYIYSLSRDSDGHVWVGTRAGGLGLLKDDRLELAHVGEIAPFPATSLLDDGKGMIWIGTTRGIERVPSQELHEAAEGSRTEMNSILLGREDGLRSSECGGLSQPSGAIAADGSLWFATAKGFAHTAPDSSLGKPTRLEAVLTGWSLEDKQFAGDPGKLQLAAGLSQVTFYFNAKRLASPGQVEFRYRLAGYDRDWTVTRNRHAAYRRLPPGRYHFEVEARDAGSPWSNAVRSIRVEQSAHLFERWWFYVLVLLVFAGLIAQLVRQKIQRTRGQLGVVLEERDRIARECHDTLLAGLAAVAWQMEATSNLLRQDVARETPVDSVAHADAFGVVVANVQVPQDATLRAFELTRSMIGHCQAEARRIIWDLRGSEEMSNTLSQALQRSISQISERPGTRTLLEVKGEEITLNPGSVHHLVCIGQEAVTNALRHAEAKWIRVRLAYTDTSLEMVVSDDGKGFSPMQRRRSVDGHFGLAVMEERARKVGGSLSLESMPGRGTNLKVTVPFEQGTSRRKGRMR